MNDHPAPHEERLFFFSPQSLTIDDFEAAGLILDLGGGGEGLIGRIKGSQVVAIDLSRDELEEAPAGPLKIVMDAGCLQFLDHSFSTATACFSFLFIPQEQHARVIAEVWRVLQPGGRFYLWDFILPPLSNPDQDVAVFPLSLQLPGGSTLSTAYGSLWPVEGRPAAVYLDLAAEQGFEVISCTQTGQTIALVMQKPACSRADQP